MVKLVDQTWQNVDEMIYTQRTSENFKIKEFIIYVHCSGKTQKNFGTFDQLQGSPALPYSCNPDSFFANNGYTSFILKGTINPKGVPIVFMASAGSMYGSTGWQPWRMRDGYMCLDVDYVYSMRLCFNIKAEKVSYQCFAKEYK